MAKLKVSKYVKDINKKRAKHYKYYTGRDWNQRSNYDLLMNVDVLGVEKTADQLVEYIKKKEE